MKYFDPHKKIIPDSSLQVNLAAVSEIESSEAFSLCPGVRDV